MLLEGGHYLQDVDTLLPGTPRPRGRRPRAAVPTKTARVPGTTAQVRRGRQVARARLCFLGGSMSGPEAARKRSHPAGVWARSKFIPQGPHSPDTRASQRHNGERKLETSIPDEHRHGITNKVSAHEFKGTPPPPPPPGEGINPRKEGGSTCKTQQRKTVHSQNGGKTHTIFFRGTRNSGPGI